MIGGGNERLGIMSASSSASSGSTAIVETLAVASPLVLSSSKVRSFPFACCSSVAPAANNRLTISM